MKTFCVKCRKNTEISNSKIFITKNNRLIMQSKFPICGIKILRFVKEQEAKDLLSNLERHHWVNSIVRYFVLRCIKMNETVNKFLLAGVKFIPEMHLKQLGFNYSVCGLFTRNKNKLKSLWRLVIHISFTEMSSIKLVYNMIWLMAN